MRWTKPLQIRSAPASSAFSTVSRAAVAMSSSQDPRNAFVSDSEEDRELRKHAVFALSQRPRDEAVPELVRIARTHRDPEIRKTAMFWLGQSGDPRAIALFEEILRN